MEEEPLAFFSYSREDSEFALRLAEDLRAAGANVWIDQIDIHPGEEWDSAVEEAVAKAPRMLLILSPASVKSKNVRNEISFALDENKVIIPVLFRDCTVPLQLHRVQHIDFRANYDRGLKSLVRALLVPQNTMAPAPRSRREGAEPPNEESAAIRPQAERSDSKTELPVFQSSPISPTGMMSSPEASMRRYAVRPKAAVLAAAILVVGAILVWTISNSRGRKPANTPTDQLQDTKTQPQTSQQSSSPTTQTSVTTSGQNVREVNSTAKRQDHGGEKLSAISKMPPDRTTDASVGKPSPAGNAESSNLPASWGSTYAETYQKAQRGDAMAMMGIGNRYKYDKDYPNALVWFHKAADAGNTWGMTSIGAAYEYGLGVETDYRQAAAWYRRAANLGDRDGMYYLGALYENGRGVPQDQQTAVDWYRKSAKLGLGDANAALKRLGVTQQ